LLKGVLNIEKLST